MQITMKLAQHIHAPKGINPFDFNDPIASPPAPPLLVTL